MSTEKKLNKQQLAAVNHGEGPLLIIAGAGTGKTTVITERVKRLIAQKLAAPSQILALTFTEKAAREMEERIDQALPLGYTQMWVMTFHSFCDRILRDEGIHIGLSPNYRLLTTTGAVSLFRSHLFDLPLTYFRPLGTPTKFIAGLLEHFDRLRDEDISPDQYLAWVKKKFGSDSSPQAHQFTELSQCFHTYQQLKNQENALDFADLILYTLKLFRTRPHLLSKYQKQFKYLLVDEYQDTNYSQNQLVYLLAGKSANLTLVADDDQSIYRWRGAAISNVLQFRKDFPKSKLVALTQNYRSTQSILDAAYQLIQFNNPDRLEIKEKIAKRLKSVSRSPGQLPQFLHFDRIENEAEAVAKKIKELLNTFSPKDVAILVRANAHAHPFLSALARLGIPAQFLGPGRLFDQAEIKDLIAFLKTVHDPTDSASFFRVLSMEFFAIPVRDLLTVANSAQKQNQTLFSACNQLSDHPQITKVVQLVNTAIDASIKFSAGQTLFNFLQNSGLLSAVLNFTHPLDARKAENISRLFSKLKAFESESPDTSIPSVLDWIDLSHEVGESPSASDTDWQDADSVNILTLHSAKGLEFPIVFLVNLVSGRFPSLERKEQIPIPDELIKESLPIGDFHLQEERRLFYVGMTRAKDQLFFTAADYYGEGKRAKKLSPFISEALGKSATLEQYNNETIQPSLFDWRPPQFSLNTSPRAISPKVNYLSYSQIQTFLTCPLHYKAKYLLKIPVPPTAASSFGNAIHRTLKSYYDQLPTNPKVKIVDLFTALWSPEGYSSPRHAQDYFDRGVRYLTEFVMTNPFPQTPVLLEQPFMVPVGPIKIGGKIDRADILADGSLHIIDYKTSQTSLDTKAAAKDLQLSFYAIAGTLIPTPPFGRRPEDIRLSLYYFSDQKTVSLSLSADQLEAAKIQILDIAHQIEVSDFRCSGSIFCRRGCDYQILCDITNTDTANV